MLSQTLNSHFDLYSKNLQHVTSLQISWEKSHHKFRYQPLDRKRWATSLSFFCATVATSSIPLSVFLLLAILSNLGETLPIINWIFILCGGSFSAWSFCTLLLAASVGEELVHGTNAIYLLILRIEVLFLPQRRSAAIHFSIHFIVWSLTLLALFLIPSIIVLGVDPMYFLIKLQNLSGFSFWIASLVRLILVTTANFENCRLFVMIIIEMFVVIMQCLKFAEYCLKKGRLKSGLIVHQHLKIALIVMDEFLHTGICLLMGVGAVTSVMVNFGTLTLYKLYPFYFYVCFLVVGVIIALVIGHTVPYMHMMFELSERILKEAAFRQRKDKVMRKFISATRPLSLSIGLFGHTFCKFRRSSKVEYYQVIVTYTINLLLGVPVSALNVV